MSEIEDEKTARRRQQWRIASAKRRADRKADGLPSESGPSGSSGKNRPSGPSGGQATAAERMRRFKERNKSRREQ